MDVIRGQYANLKRARVFVLVCFFSLYMSMK